MKRKIAEVSAIPVVKNTEKSSEIFEEVSKPLPGFIFSSSSTKKKENPQEDTNPIIKT